LLDFWGEAQIWSGSASFQPSHGFVPGGALYCS